MKEKQDFEQDAFYTFKSQIKEKENNAFGTLLVNKIMITLWWSLLSLPW